MGDGTGGVNVHGVIDQCIPNCLYKNLRRRQKGSGSGESVNGCAFLVPTAPLRSLHQGPDLGIQRFNGRYHQIKLPNHKAQGVAHWASLDSRGGVEGPAQTDLGKWFCTGSINEGGATPKRDSQAEELRLGDANDFYVAVEGSSGRLSTPQWAAKVKSPNP